MDQFRSERRITNTMNKVSSPAIVLRGSASSDVILIIQDLNKRGMWVEPDDAIRYPGAIAGFFSGTSYAEEYY